MSNGGASASMLPAAVALLCLALSGACSRSAAPASPEPEAGNAADAAHPAPGRPERGVRLADADIAKLGITIAPAAAATYVGQIEGYGSVLGREVVALALTDVITARAAARLSHAALDRMKRLEGTPGADSAMVRENAERQTVADDAALDLALAKAASVLGQGSPWLSAKSSELFRSLAAGRIKIIRVSFPLGSFPTGAPAHLRVTRLDTGAKPNLWRVPALWPAPADGTLPGRSYFAIVEASDLAEGEHVLAWATDTAAPHGVPGVFIPAAALVIGDARYWCYTRQPDGAFVRIAVDISRPQPGGYFVAAGLDPGAPVVTAGAGLLLAREANAAAVADP